MFVQAAQAQRKVVARRICPLKRFRRVATRYDKRTDAYLALVTLATIMLWLK